MLTDQEDTFSYPAIMTATAIVATILGYAIVKCGKFFGNNTQASTVPSAPAMIATSNNVMATVETAVSADKNISASTPSKDTREAPEVWAVMPNQSAVIAARDALKSTGASR